MNVTLKYPLGAARGSPPPKISPNNGGATQKQPAAYRSLLLMANHCIFVPYAHHNIMDLPRASDHKDDSIRLIRTLIDRGCTWKQALAIASTKYKYAGHRNSEFRVHWILAKRLPDGEVGGRTKGDDATTQPKELILTHYQGRKAEAATDAIQANILSRDEALQIATEIAWGQPYVVRVPGYEGRGYEVRIIPNIKERLRALDLIIKTQGFTAQKKDKGETNIAHKLGAAGLRLEDNSGPEDAEIVE